MTERIGRRPTYADKFALQFKHNALIKRHIMKQARKPDTFLVIHGARALNKHLPSHLDRPTKDWDSWAKKPKLRMDKMEDALDKAVGSDMFYEVETTITGTNKKVYRVFSRLTNDAVVDYTKAPNKKGYYQIIGRVRWETLAHAKKVYQKILKDPQFKFRWAKTKIDLNRILEFEGTLKKVANRRH